MAYIGASLVDVKAALKKRGQVLLSGRREGHGWTYDIGGAGAVKLSIRLARQLVDRWWASPAGTKIVLGFLTGKENQVNVERHNFLPRIPGGPPPPRRSAIKVMEIVRPPRTPNTKFQKARNVFQWLVVDKMSRMGEHKYTNYADQPHEQRHIGLYSATWFLNPKAWPQPYIVWPAGILSNRNTDAVAHVQKGWQILENTRHVLPDVNIPHDMIKYSNRWVTPVFQTVGHACKKYSNRWVTPAILDARRALRTRALSHTNTRPINVRRREFYDLESAPEAARRNGAARAIQQILLERIYRPGGQMSGPLKNRFEAKQRNLMIESASRKRKRKRT
jgi:hypothetical protein